MKTNILLLILCFLLCSSCTEKIPKELPNILWITSEDNGTFLGCYGDSFATTPNLDKLASEGILYTHAFANAPVCAPARNTIITGVYASSGGHEHMRSTYQKSESIHYYPKYLREKGYYCTNNSKTDYNIEPEQLKNIWDESSREAHYKNRKQGQPFFAIFNSTLSHESSIHRWKPDEKLRHRPEDVQLPSYHPDIPELRHDWAHYYDNVEDMDTWVGEILKELEDSGEAENTIVFYYSDHGGVLGRSKRFLYETGTHVPFIIRIPEKYKYLLDGKEPGSKDDRLVSFVDLAPTLLSIIGTPVPEYMQGKAFLGKQETQDPDYVYMFRGRMDERYDMSRSVRSEKYRYTINFMSFRPYGQYINYLWLAPSMKAWEQAFNDGRCNKVQAAFFNPKPKEELYLSEEDPWEINNLAGDPQYKEVLKEMRQAYKEWVRAVKDPGFIPEPIRFELYGNSSTYDVVRQESFPLERIMEAAEMSVFAGPDNIDQVAEFLKDEDPVIRYWGVLGLLNLGENANTAIPDLEKALDDPSEAVALMAAETLYGLGKEEEVKRTIVEILDNDNYYLKTYAMNSIDCLNLNDEFFKAKVSSLDAERQKGISRYDYRMIDRLMDKWGMQVEAE